MEINEIFNAISNNGFAIFVAIYMLVYQNKSMSTLTEAVNRACLLLQTLAEKEGVNHE